MWRMDSLSVGISILCGWQKTRVARLQTVSGARLPVVPDHDRWKWRSRCSGMSDHDGLESVITIGWNAHPKHDEVSIGVGTGPLIGLQKVTTSIIRE
jgi:hypothetical protein